MNTIVTTRQGKVQGSVSDGVYFFKGTLILVVDGARSSLFRNTGAALAPELVKIESLDHQSPSTTELGTDRPGRRFESVGTGRGAYESPDYHQQEEDDFARDATAHLNRLAADGKHKLILVATPKVLGTMRPHIAAKTHQLLIGEIAKNYAGRSAQDVADLLVRHE